MAANSINFSLIIIYLSPFSTNDFKKKVLDIAMPEIAYNSDYSVEYKEIKNGRKIIGFAFKLYSQHSTRGRELLEKHGINAVTGMYYKDEK